MAFAGRLKQLRQAQGWSQAEMAEKAGLTRDGIAHLEQGRREPGWATVQAWRKHRRQLRGVRRRCVIRSRRRPRRPDRKGQGA